MVSKLRSNIKFSILFALVFILPVLAFSTELETAIRDSFYKLAEHWDENQGEILNFLKDTDPIKRKYAIEVIPLNVQSEVPLKVVPLIDDLNIEVRIAAINRFVDWSVEESIKPLTRALHSENAKVHQLALMALVHQGKSALEFLEDVVEKTADDEWLAYTYELLNSIRLGDPEWNVIISRIQESIENKLER